MAVPVSQAWTVATYVLKQKMMGRKKYPLVLMLEPLFRCNLACAGCGKIQYPAHILKAELSPEDCFKAVEECGTPMVAIPGGEPLLHPRMQQRFAAGDRNHRGSALFDRLEAVFGRKLRLQDVRGILNLAAAGARQIAAEQRLQHQHQRILLPAHQLLLQNISCNRPGMRDWDCHPVSPPSKVLLLQ